MEILFLGTSSCEKIPRPGCNCLQCKSKDSRDKRTRSAILIDGKILVDCGPDIIKQFKIYNVKYKKIENVIITHTHKDHIGGLGDFQKENPKAKIVYPKDSEKFEIEGIKFFAFRVPHSRRRETIALLINDVIYCPDIRRIPSNLKSILRKGKLIIFDGSCWNIDFGYHLAMTKSIPILKTFPAKKIYFTHNGHTHIPHYKLEIEIQKIGDDRFHLAYDGLKI